MKRQKPNLATVAEYRLTFGHRPCAVGVLGAFAMNVGTKSRKCRNRRCLIEDRHVIDHLKRRDQLGAIRLGHDRPGIAFDGSDARIAVDADDQDVTQSLRIPKTADVSDVEKVETAIRPHDSFPGMDPFGAVCD